MFRYLLILSLILLCFEQIAFAKFKSEETLIITGWTVDPGWHGNSISIAGDVNGDGITDLIVGSEGQYPGSELGKAYIFFGDFSGFDSLDVDQANVVLSGENPGDLFGFTVSTAGDVNNDGFDDVIIGAENAGRGRAYVFYGGEHLHGNLNASDAHVILTSETNIGSSFGRSVSTAGDVNNDGNDDIIVGDPYNQALGSSTGRAYIFFGGPSLKGILNANQANVIITGNNSGDRFGCSVSNAGDINNDNIDDIIVSTQEGGRYGVVGKAYIFFGHSSFSGTYNANSANVRLAGISYGDKFGSSVSNAGDVNGDGIDDVIVGASSGGSYEEGCAYIFYGDPLISGYFIADKANVILTGENADGRFGLSISNAGDLNSDGVDDVVVGAPANTAIGNRAGRSYVFFGGKLLSGNVSAGDANVILKGENEDDMYGYSVSSAGDINDDGVDELFVGAIINDSGGTYAGRAYVYNLYGINLFSPNGGEIWSGGTSQEIIWEIVKIASVDHIKLTYSLDGGLNYPNTIADNVPNSGSFTWSIPAINSNQIKVRVQALDSSNDVIAENNSYNNFTIESTITLISPNGGEYWRGGSQKNIIWETSGPFADYVSLFYSTDGGYTFPNIILENAPNDGSFSWSVPYVDIPNAIIKIQTIALDGTVISEDVSDSDFYIDSTLPLSFDLMNPANGEWVTPSPVFTWQRSEDNQSGLLKYQLWIDGVVDKDSIYINQSSCSPNSPLLDGVHTWSIKALDRAGNVRNSNQTWTVRVDATSPSAFSLLAPADSSGTNNPLPTFTWQASSDAGSGLKKYQLYIDEVLNRDNIAPSTTSTTPVSALSSTNHPWYVIAVDNANNSRQSNEVRVISIDTYPPTAFNLSSPAHNSWTGDTTPTFAWNPSSDYGSGLLKYELWIDGVVRVDSIASSITSLTLSSDMELGPGDHMWHIKAYDKALNVQQSESEWRLKVDVTAPSGFSLVSPPDSGFANIPTPDFSWNAATDAGSGISHYQLWIDGILSTDYIANTTSSPGTPISEGPHYWYVNAIDNVGNLIKSDQTWTVFAEWNPPQAFDLASPSNGDTVTKSQPVLTWHPSEDVGSGISKYELWIDGVMNRENISGNDTSTTPKSPLANGTHNWFVKAFDMAMNETASNSIWTIIVDRDATAPNSVIIDPIQGQTIGGTSYTIKGTANDGEGSGIKIVHVSIDGGANWHEVQSTSENFATWQWEWTGLEQGSYTIQSRATDVEGNIETPGAGVTVNVDMSKPSVKNIIVTPNPTSSGNIQISVEFEVGSIDLNYSAVPSVTFTPNGGAKTPFIQTSYEQKIWRGTSTIAGTENNGTATVAVSGAMSNSGNAMDPDNNAGSFVIDTVAPTVRSVVVNPDPAKAGNINLAATFEEATSGLDALTNPIISFTPLGGTPISISQTSYDAAEKKWTGTATITGELNDGQATIQVKNVKDLAGNTMTENGNAGFFIIDVTPPVAFELTAPRDSEWVATSKPELIWQSSADATSGLIGYQLFINEDLNVENIAPSKMSILPAADLVEGASTWYVVALDSALNSTRSISSRLLRIDTAAPVSQIVNLTSGMSVSADTVVIEGTANDGIGEVAGSGVDSVFISFDSGNIWHPTLNTGINFSTWQYLWIGFENKEYIVKSKAIDKLGNTEIPEEGAIVTQVEIKQEDSVPIAFGLLQNYPNPFNPETVIHYQTSEPCRVSIKVYNALGREIRTLLENDLNPGYHQVIWNGMDNVGNRVGTGIYIYQMRAGDFVDVKKMIKLQ